MNIVIIADVGSAERHTGDEALFEAALAELRKRGANSFTLIAPAAGPSVPDDVRLVAPIGFDDRPGSAHDVAREMRLEQVLALTTDDPLIAGVVAAVSNADAVVVAGGGNLSATWPHHLYERVALLEIAARHGVPTIVSGQTIGPTLTYRQRAGLRHALAGARFVGVRDLPSLNLLEAMGAAGKAVIQVDDAITLPMGPVDQSLPEAYVALCAHQYDSDRERVGHEVAALVAALHKCSGLPVVLFPNTAGVDQAKSCKLNPTDDQLAMDVAAIIGSSKVVSVAPVTTTTATADGIRRSAAVVSMRFHPLVFALAAGVPCMAITSDQYTGVKLEGAMRHAGLAGWQVPTDALATPIVAQLFDELWLRRAEIRAHVLAITPAWFDRHRERWDAIWSSIVGDGPGVIAQLNDSRCEVVELQPVLSAARWSTALAAAGRERLALAAHRFDTAEETAYSVRRILEFREIEIEGWRTQTDNLKRRLAVVDATSPPPTE